MAIHWQELGSAKYILLMLLKIASLSENEIIEILGVHPLQRISKFMKTEMCLIDIILFLLFGKKNPTQV